MSDPRIWGTDLWKTLHRFSLAYPVESPSEQHKQKARDFYGSLDTMLPCPWCRVHYGRYFKRTFDDETVENRKALVQWVYDLHNEVNRRLGKPKSDVSVEDLPRLYNSFPLRYVDLKTGELLDKPRHDVTEGRDCPSDELALKKLLKKKQGKDSDGPEKEENEEEESSQADDDSQVSIDVLSDTRNAVEQPTFWASPWGVSLLWLIGIATVLFVILLVRSVTKAQKESEKRQGRQQWVVFDKKPGISTAAGVGSLPPGYQNPWPQ